jgi:Bacterial oxidoreductases, C-terminal
VSAPTGGLTPYSRAFWYGSDATNAVIFVTQWGHISVNDVELQDREFFAVIREGREPNASVAPALPCYRALDDLDKQLATG